MQSLDTHQRAITRNRPVKPDEIWLCKVFQWIKSEVLQSQVIPGKLRIAMPGVGLRLPSGKRHESNSQLISKRNRPLAKLSLSCAEIEWLPTVHCRVLLDGRGNSVAGMRL